MAWTCACSADPPFRDETDGVITVYSDEASYGDFDSYVMNVALEELCVQSQSKSSDPSSLEPDEPRCANIDHGADREVLARLRDNMNSLDLERFEPSQVDDSELYLVAGIVSVDYWDLGEPFCIDNGIVDGCVRPLTKQNVFAPVGSLVLVLLDLTASDDGQLEPIWAASIDRRWAAGSALGVALGGAGGEGGSNSASFDLEPWLGGIDQAFGQSPYLSGEISP